MFLFRNSRTKSDIPPPADRLSFERIQKQWEESCVSHNIELPGKVQAEFKKRIKQFGSVQDCGKAKLNLSKCDLDDQMVLFLIEALAATPAIARLDLSGNNITDKSAICLIRLLLMQAKMVRLTEPKDRFDAIFLSEILLLNNRTLIEQRILDDITTVSDSLHHANVKNIILRASINFIPFTIESIEMLCMAIMGKQIEEKKLLSAISEDKDRDLDSDDLISYTAIEDLIISELVISKILNPLSTSQVKQIRVRPAVRLKNASRWMMSGQDPGPRTGTDASPSADHDDDDDNDQEQGLESIDEVSEDFDDIYRDQIGWDATPPIFPRSPESIHLSPAPAPSLALTPRPHIMYDSSDSSDDSSDSGDEGHCRVGVYPASKTATTGSSHDRTVYGSDSRDSGSSSIDDARRSVILPDARRGVDKGLPRNSIGTPRGVLVGEEECKENALETFVDNMSDVSTGVDSTRINTPRATLIPFVYDMTPTKEWECEDRENTADSSSEKSSEGSVLSAFPVHDTVRSHPLPSIPPFFVIKKSLSADAGQGLSSSAVKVSPRYLVPLTSGTSRSEADKTEHIGGTEMREQDRQLISSISSPSSPIGGLPTILEEIDASFLSASPSKMLLEEPDSMAVSADPGDCVDGHAAVSHADNAEGVIDYTGYRIEDSGVSADASDVGDVGDNEGVRDSVQDLLKINRRMSGSSDDSVHVQRKGLVKSMVLILEKQNIIGIIPPDLGGDGVSADAATDTTATATEESPRHSPYAESNVLSPLTPSPSSRRREVAKSMTPAPMSVTDSSMPSPLAILPGNLLVPEASPSPSSPPSLVLDGREERLSAFRAKLIAKRAAKGQRGRVFKREGDTGSSPRAGAGAGALMESDSVEDSAEASETESMHSSPSPSPGKAFNGSNVILSDADWSTSVSPMAHSSPHHQLQNQSEFTVIPESSSAPYSLLPPQAITPIHSSASASASATALESATTPTFTSEPPSDGKEERVSAFRAKLIANRAARTSFSASSSPPISPFRDGDDSNILSPASLGMSMASTPDTMGNAGPAGVVKLPLKKALSLLSGTHPAPTLALAPAHSLVPSLVPVPVLLPAQDQHPLASPRRGSGIVYRSRDDDSNLFQLAATIVLPDEIADDADDNQNIHDIHDAPDNVHDLLDLQGNDDIHDILNIDGAHDKHYNHDIEDIIHDNNEIHDMQDVPDNHDAQAATCLVSEGTTLEEGTVLDVQQKVEVKVKEVVEKETEEEVEKGSEQQVEKGAEQKEEKGVEKRAAQVVEEGAEKELEQVVEGNEGLQEGCERANASPVSDLAAPIASDKSQSTEGAHSGNTVPVIAANSHDDNTEAVIIADNGDTVPVIAATDHRGDEQAHGTEDAVCVQSRRDSGIPLPVPRGKTLIKCPSADKPLDSVADAAPDSLISSTQKASGKIDILRSTRRTPGSGTASAGEGSRSSTPSSNVTPHNGLASAYSDEDYAEYAQDNLDGLGQGTFFADDNPTFQSASVRDSGRLCDFSGPLGEKIKESILEHMAIESMDSTVEQVTALEGEEVAPGTPRSSLGSPSAVPKALSKTCPVVLSSPAPQSNPLSVSMPALCSRTSGLSPPSSPTFSLPPERKRRSVSSAASSSPGGLHTVPLPAKPILPPPTPPSPILSSPFSPSPTPPQPARSSTKPPSPTPPSLNLSSSVRSSPTPPTPSSLNLPLPARSLPISSSPTPPSHTPSSPTPSSLDLPSARSSPTPPSPTPPSLNIPSPTPPLAIHSSPVSRSPTHPSPTPPSPVRTHVSPSHVPRTPTPLTPTPPLLVLPTPVLPSPTQRTPTPPSPIAHYRQESSPSKKILPTSATSFSIFSASNGTINGSPKGVAVAVGREVVVASHTALESTATTLEETKVPSGLEIASRSENLTALRGSSPVPPQMKASASPVPSRQLWTKPVTPNTNALTNSTKSPVTKSVEAPLVVDAKVEVKIEVKEVREVEVSAKKEQCQSNGGSHERDSKCDISVRKKMSTTIFYPEDEKRKRNSSAQLSVKSSDVGHAVSRGTAKEGDSEKKKEKDKEKDERERNDFLLDLTDRHLTTFDASLHHLYPRSKLNLVCVLILRNNQLSDLPSMRLKEMVCVTDLDLAYNGFTGAVPHSAFPRNIERLDLEGNGFDDFSGLVTCSALRSINISHNRIKDIAALPSKVVDLDISHNQLSSPLHLRLLSLTPSIKTLRICGNPIVEASAFCRVIVCSVLPNILQLDDVYIPGCGVRRKHSAADRESSIQSRAEPQHRAELSQSLRNTSKALQEERDIKRHEAHAKKMKAAGRAQDSAQKHIRVLSTTAPLGPQATELMVRRLTWVAPNKAAAASFFGASVAHSGLISNEKAQSMKSSTLNGTETGTVPGNGNRNGSKAKVEMKNRTEQGRVSGRISASTQPMVPMSKPLLRNNSSGSLSHAARSTAASSVTASATVPQYSLRQGERERDRDRNREDKSKEGRTSDTPNRVREEPFLRPSRSMDSSSFSTFSTFGASKCSNITRSNSAHRMGTTHPDGFKPFSRHSELPPSPGRDKRNAVHVVNKWLKDSVQELGKASVVLGLAFWITEQPRIESNSGINFTAAMDSVPFLREMTVERWQGRGPRRASKAAATASMGVTGHYTKLDKALEVVASGSSSVQGSSDRDDYLYLLAAVEAAKGNMESFTYVLTEIEKAIHAANSHQDSVKPRQLLLDLRGQLEDVMCSTKGRIVNELVLAPFGCQLVWHGDRKESVDLTSATECAAESPERTEQHEGEGAVEDEDDEDEAETEGEHRDRDYTNSTADSVPSRDANTIPVTGSPTVSSKPARPDLPLGSDSNPSPVQTAASPAPTPSRTPASTPSPIPTRSPTVFPLPTLIPEIYTHGILDEETIKTFNAVNNGFYGGSKSADKPYKASPSYGTGAPTPPPTPPSTSLPPFPSTPLLPFPSTSLPPSPSTPLPPFPSTPLHPSPPTPSRTLTRVSAEDESPEAVAQRMDPLIKRFRLKYGLPVSAPAPMPGTDIAGQSPHTQGSSTTATPTKFGPYLSPEVWKPQSPDSQSPGHYPPSPLPYHPSPVPPKGYLGSFVASSEVTKMQGQVRSLRTVRPDTSRESVRIREASMASELLGGVRPSRSPGVSREGYTTHQTEPQLALSENTTSGCSMEFLTGEQDASDVDEAEDLEREQFDHRMKHSDHDIPMGSARPMTHTYIDTDAPISGLHPASATGKSASPLGLGPLIPEGPLAASRERESAYLDHDNVYHHSDSAMHITDTRAAQMSSFKISDQLRKNIDALRGVEGAVAGLSNRVVKGVDDEVDRFSSSRPFFTELAGAHSSHRNDQGSSPRSLNMRVSQNMSFNAISAPSSPAPRVHPSIHISPSFGFTNSYAEPVPFGRFKSSKTLTHAALDLREKDNETLNLSQRSSVAGDELVVPSPSFRRAKGFITSPSAPSCPSSPAIISTLLNGGLRSRDRDGDRERGLVASPENGRSFSASKAASIDTSSISYSSSFIIPEGNSPGGAYSLVHASPKMSQRTPYFDPRFSAPPSPSPCPTESPSIQPSNDHIEPLLLSVNERRESLNRLNIEFQHQMAASAPSSAVRKTPPASIDIRGYNSEAAMAVKARLATPLKGGKSVETVSGEMAERFRTFTEPSIPLCVIVGEHV